MVFARLGLRPPFAALAAARRASLATTNKLPPVTALPVRNAARVFSRLTGLPRFSSSVATPASTADETIINLIDNHVNSGFEDAFYVINLDDVVEKHKTWERLLPRVQPFYAVKCNPDPVVVQLLAGLGANFDCASRPEMELVMSYGVTPDRVIYANPCKQISHLRYAANKSVDYMTFDSADELRKIKQYHPNAKLVIRIKADDSHSQCEMGSKYGANLDNVKSLLTTAQELNLDVVGVSYHVGSGCYSAYAFVDAVQRARKTFDMASEVGFQFELLDIGGGFPGDENSKISFEEICTVLRPALDKYFPLESGVSIIAEPGRYYVGSSHTLAVNVIGRKEVAKLRPVVNHVTGSERNHVAAQLGTSQAMAVHTEAVIPSYMYYVNDGLYGSFNCLLYDHATVEPIPLKKRVVQEDVELSSNDELVHCSIWGPTCDGFDCITKDARLPQLDIGEWLYFPNMGAYTAAAGSQFNGFELPNRLYFGTGNWLANVVGDHLSVNLPEKQVESRSDDEVAA